MKTVVLIIQTLLCTWLCFSEQSSFVDFLPNDEPLNADLADAETEAAVSTSAETTNAGIELPDNDVLARKMINVDGDLLDEVSIRKRTPMPKKKVKPIVFNGYNIDINVDTFKSTRVCHYHEVCKVRYKQHFECRCPTSTLCAGMGQLYDGNCVRNMMPYVWLQSLKFNLPTPIKPKM